jgi:aryl-phospho-beta-D-glucosidase BglC (GH1 family)
MKSMKHTSKRLLTLALALILTFALVPAIIAAESEPILDPGITIRANGELRQPTDAEGNPVYPILYNGTTYIPVRGLSYLLGKTVAWVSDARTIAITDTPVTAPSVKTAVPPAPKTLTGVRPDQSIKITYNGAAKQLTDVNGKPVYPILYNGTNYAPLRGALGLFGITPEYDGASKTISFTQTAAIGVMRDITAAQLVAEIKIGTNHCNALSFGLSNFNFTVRIKDNIGYMEDPDPNNPYSKLQELTLWRGGVAPFVPPELANEKASDGSEFYTLEKFRQVIQAFKEAGYNAVRLPVDWTAWTNDITFEIDEDWLDLVESCVQIILDAGLYCIIDTHEDYLGISWVGDHWDKEWLASKYKQYVDTRFAALWKQISERFKSYGDYLLFESFNEPFSDLDNSYCTARINELQELFVKTVRETGGNNAKRFLSLTYYNAGLFSNLQYLQLPKDTRLIVQVHYYYTYGLGDFRPVTSWSKNDTAQIDSAFDTIKQFVDETGVPVILGEFGNTEIMPTADRIAQAKYILEKATELGIPAFWWEETLSSSINDKSTYFSLYNRNKMAWEHPDILKAIMQTVNG